MVLCQFCGARNADDPERCVRCGNKLLVLSGVVDEVDETNEEMFFQAQEELEEHLLERLTAVEDSVRQLSSALAGTGEHLAQIEHNLTVTHAGVQALGHLLETQGVVSRAEMLDGWERLVGQEMLSRDLSRRFHDRSRRILSQAEHAGCATERFRSRLRALELALMGGQNDEAERLLNELVAMAPDNDEMWSFVGEAAFETGDLESARIAFRKVLELRGPHYETLVYLGTVASDLGFWEEAEEALRAARDMAPDSFLPHFTLGALSVVRSDHSAGVKHLERCLEQQELPQALYLLGISRLHLGHTGRAIQVLQRAVALAPDYEEAIYQLGVAYLRRGWSKRAMETFRQVLRLDPQRLQYQETVRLLATSSSDDLPPKVAGMVRRAEAALERDRVEPAMELYSKAATAAPDQLGLQATAALLASSLGRYREAVRLAHRVLREDTTDSPFRAAAVVALLEALRQVGRVRSVRRMAQAFFEGSADNLARGMAAYELALAETELGDDLDRARELAREALEITPKELRHYPLAALGAIALKRGRFREAVQYLEQATETAPQRLLLRQLAVARLGTGDSEGAEAALEAAEARPDGGLNEELLGHVRQLGAILGDLPFGTSVVQTARSAIRR